MDKKRYILGSTFSKELIYDNGFYRTVSDENVLILIANTGKDLGGKKKGRRDLFRLPSRSVVSPDELSDHFLRFFINICKVKDAINQLQ